MTIESTTQVFGLNETLLTLREIDNALQDPIEPREQGLQLLYENTRVYPPRLPNQQYIRTFALQNSWAILLEQSRVQSTGPDYNIYVKLRAKQAKIHQGRHETVEDVAENREQDVADGYDEYFQELLNGG